MQPFAAALWRPLRHLLRDVGSTSVPHFNEPRVLQRALGFDDGRRIDGWGFTAEIEKDGGSGNRNPMTLMNLLSMLHVKMKDAAEFLEGFGQFAGTVGAWNDLLGLDVLQMGTVILNHAV